MANYGKNPETFALAKTFFSFNGGKEGTGPICRIRMSLEVMAERMLATHKDIVFPPIPEKYEDYYSHAEYIGILWLEEVLKNMLRGSDGLLPPGDFREIAEGYFDGDMYCL